MPESEEGFIYLTRKRKKFWGTTRYEYTSHATEGRARGAAKSSIRQGPEPLEPIKIFKIPVESMIEVWSSDKE